MSMNISFLAPKTLGSIITGGSACAGGGIIYYYQMPKTWQELFAKEGWMPLSNDNEFKAVYEDQKDKEHWKGENQVKDATVNDAHTKAKAFCESQLKNRLPSRSDPSFESTKAKLKALCTVGGIVTVKGKLAQHGKSGWINGDGEDDKYKTVFAVYRHHEKFINWLNNKSSEANLSSSSKVNDNFARLKTTCADVLAKPHSSVTSEDEYSYVGWWCKALEQDKVKERIESTHKGWTQENDGTKIKSLWEHTTSVTNQITQDLSKKEGESLEGTDYKKWCDDQLKKELKEEGIYKNKYIMVMSACKTTSGG